MESLLYEKKLSISRMAGLLHTVQYGMDSSGDDVIRFCCRCCLSMKKYTMQNFLLYMICLLYTSDAADD